MAYTTATVALLLGLNLVLLAQAQDRLQLGGCPNSYVTTFDFDARKISEMIGSAGYQTIMTLGTGTEQEHHCQKLQLFEGAAFSYSYMDEDGEKHQVSGRYRAIPTSFKTHGFLELFGLPIGVLGANIFGTALLYPLVSRADAHVYLSCTQLGFLHTENVYTFVPNDPSSLRGAEDIRETLALMGVPYSKTLVRADQACLKPEEPSNTTSNDTSSSGTPSSEGAASNTTSRDAPESSTSSRVFSVSDTSSSGASASNTSQSNALASEASPSNALSSNASSSNTPASDASSSGVAASDASSSDVLPSGASSNDALASVASSIDALASDVLSSNAASNTTQRDVESNTVEDGPQKASSDAEVEPATESSAA